MKRRYTFHPQDYAVGENEKYYADMAQRGWILEKRGATFSRYRRTEPQKLKYRIELSSPAYFDDDQQLPDEQVALYEESGWKYVTSAGLVHIFCAPENSSVPEFYNDPRQQAATVKALKRSYVGSCLAVMLLLAVHVVIAAAMAGNAGEWLVEFGAEVRIAWVRATALVLAWFGLMAVLFYDLLRGVISTQLLYRRLRSGRPIDHSPKRPAVYRVIRWVLGSLTVLFALLFVIQLCGVKTAEMPDEADGPYLLLRDMGWTGERTINYLGRPSEVETARSLAARQWHTYECVSDGADSEVWMYQDVYQMRSPARAMALAPVLMRDATFAHGPESFSAVSVPGLDAAWRAGMEFIAVRGDTVWYITYSDPGLYSPEEELLGDPLAALAHILNAEETSGE